METSLSANFHNEGVGPGCETFLSYSLNSFLEVAFGYKQAIMYRPTVHINTGSGLTPSYHQHSLELGIRLKHYFSQRLLVDATTLTGLMAMYECLVGEGVNAGVSYTFPFIPVEERLGISYAISPQTAIGIFYGLLWFDSSESRHWVQSAGLKCQLSF